MYKLELINFLVSYFYFWFVSVEVEIYLLYKSIEWRIVVNIRILLEVRRLDKMGKRLFKV